jgi:hypothetical protein
MSRDHCWSLFLLLFHSSYLSSFFIVSKHDNMRCFLSFSSLFRFLLVWHRNSAFSCLGALYWSLQRNSFFSLFFFFISFSLFLFYKPPDLPFYFLAFVFSKSQRHVYYLPFLWFLFFSYSSFFSNTTERYIDIYICIYFFFYLLLS